jgi:hypothetical protein
MSPGQEFPEAMVDFGLALSLWMYKASSVDSEVQYWLGYLLCDLEHVTPPLGACLSVIVCKWVGRTGWH